MAKKKESLVIHDPMTQNVDVKVPYTDTELVMFSHAMADALGAIAQIEMEMKEYATARKAEIAEHEKVL